MGLSYCNPDAKNKPYYFSGLQDSAQKGIYLKCRLVRLEVSCAMANGQQKLRPGNPYLLGFLG